MTVTILKEQVDRVAILTVNRPDKMNALNQQVRDEMLALLDEIETDDTVGVVVLTGAGDKAFIAGADISEFEGRSPFDQRHAMRQPRIFDAMASFSKPVIAMINGYCLGGGCELALSCDLRIASEKARFGQPEINLGLIPGGGGTQRLPRLVGLGHAMRLILGATRGHFRAGNQNRLSEPADVARRQRIGPSQPASGDRRGPALRA
jgi:enoyl-CoA hydratase